MTEPKQVRVDNWGIYFLQRLKHFFNRTDYCDLTLQFQDNAQLKVHRLVLSACTEYFELLERTCEMYEDCLVMPDDLQADVVVPIVNFMYTGQLEFKMDILERLHACSEIMNMPVLTKLLDSHRPKNRSAQNLKRPTPKPLNAKFSPSVEVIPLVTAGPAKRSYTKAFNKNVVYKDKKHHQALNKASAPMNVTNGGVVYRPPSPIPFEVHGKATQKFIAGEPRPTRYELPEELDADNLFESSFSNISYTSQPLMVHPETTKHYAKRPKQAKEQASTSKKSRSTTLDIVECKKVNKEPDDNLYEESASEVFKPSYVNQINVKTEQAQDPNKLFDQLLDHNEEHTPNVTIETTKKAAANLDHAKIISEVLKKYPHLVKSNKNIKLKIFNNPTQSKVATKRQKQSPKQDNCGIFKTDDNSDYTYETDVMDSKQAAKLIAQGAENIEGPWICLICGTPGKALHFTSYFKFRRHLTDVHNEKPVLNICEYCGQRMNKRNHLLHHMYTKHGVEPPPSCNFPKCSQCNYIALTEAFLVKHKLSHIEAKNFRCNVCYSPFTSSSKLLAHIQSTGHKYIAARKHSHQCIYCLRVFLRENNLFAHLKTHHKINAIRDGIIDESDEESKEDLLKVVKHEENEFDDNNMEYHIQQKPDGNIQLIQKKPTEATTPSKQKILNSGLTSDTPKAPPSKLKASRKVQNIQNSTEQNENTLSYSDNNSPEIIVIDNNEYIMSGNRLTLRRSTKETSEEYILSDIIQETHDMSSQSITTSMNYTAILNPDDNIQQASIMMKDAEDLDEPIPIYVSNEEEYKTLITSNHNIIFDSCETNKTLTVLTTPDAATIDTSIDLDNTQNNDMMIIEDEYPLNVSETVATENSNIVVVYSHQMREPNTEYQLITTQALGPQYAQSSAILTHSYETVSTASPVMSAHIPDSSVVTWQGEIHQNISNQHSNAVIQSIVHAEEIHTTNPPESMVDLIDLPQVQLVSDASVSANNNQNENINKGPPENLEEELKQSTQNLTMEIDTPLVATAEEKKENVASVESISEEVQHPQEVNNTEIPIEQEPVSENLLVAEQLQDVINMKVQSPDTNESVISDRQSSDTNENVINSGVQIADTNSNVTSVSVQSSDTHANVISIEFQDPNSNEKFISMEVQSSDTIEKISMNAQISDTKETIDKPETITVTAVNSELDSKNELSATEAVEQIQTLTSEWSEDDVDTPPQDTTSTINPENKYVDVEESIENIQQELEKQMIQAILAKDKETHADVVTLQNDERPTSQKEKSETKHIDEPQVKISSLLNDWDDNDSQEDNEMDESEGVSNEPVVENVPTNIPDSNDMSTAIPESESAATQENATSISEYNDVKELTSETESSAKTEVVDKQDKIKSLVSDWDDEDEENKE